YRSTLQSLQLQVAESVRPCFDPPNPLAVAIGEALGVEVLEQKPQLIRLGAELRSQCAHRRDVMNNTVLPPGCQSNAPADRSIEKIDLESIVRQRSNQNVSPEQVAMNETGLMHVAHLPRKADQDFQPSPPRQSGAAVMAVCHDERRQRHGRRNRLGN